MKNSITLILLCFSISFHAQDTQGASELQNTEVISMATTDSLQTKILFIMMEL